MSGPLWGPDAAEFLQWTLFENSHVDAHVDDQDYGADRNFDRARQTCRIDERENIVRDETAAVSRASCAMEQPVLDSRQWTVPPHPLDDDSPDRRGQMKPDQPGPA